MSKMICRFLHTKTHVAKNFMYILQINKNIVIDIDHIKKTAFLFKDKKKTVFSKTLYDYLKQKYQLI